uniref:HDC17598 n=1 Tax=Drosophila melanogaster TaxID=7227 RepID=Q6IIM5_DROME|nr:TPA_inf: HDC17598 [Drosophila melanogaster]
MAPGNGEKHIAKNGAIARRWKLASNCSEYGQLFACTNTLEKCGGGRKGGRIQMNLLKRSVASICKVASILASTVAIKTSFAPNENPG